MPGEIEPRQQRAASQQTILLVEDQILIREGISTYLRDGGFRVIEATGAEEAMAVFASGAAVDFVFSDVDMPGGADGLMLAAWIARNHPGVPVLLTSGEGISNRPGVEGAGRFAFEPKPYLFSDIETRIRLLLAEKDDRG